MYEEDFVTDEIIEFEVDGKPFGFKPVTTADETSWSEEYIEYFDGKPKQNLDKLTQCKVRNLVKVPYDKETINKIIGIDKEWTQLTKEQRWQLIGKLKPEVFNKIIRKINKLGLQDEELKKK